MQNNSFINKQVNYLTTKCGTQSTHIAHCESTISTMSNTISTLRDNIKQGNTHRRLQAQRIVELEEALARSSTISTLQDTLDRAISSTGFKCARGVDCACPYH